MKSRGDLDKMLLSSRANPPKSLGPFPSRHLTVKQILLSSPLPSPQLPALLPRHGKKPPPLNTRRALRWLCWLAIAITLYYLASFAGAVLLASTVSDVAPAPYQLSSGKTYQIVEESRLPDYPTPIAVTDHKGQHGWTISIPDKLAFPLPAADYADICSHVDEVARHVSKGKHGHSGHHSHSHRDSNFIDVDEAQQAGLLPHKQYQGHSHQTLPVCKSSLTYVLDASDAGLGPTLLGLWLSYSMAKQEGRAFFVDDFLFPYGNYGTYFQTPDAPSCRPPPKSQRVPCPHQAKHLVVSGATHEWTFGEAFRKRHSQREIFDMAREGYKALFHLRRDDMDYASHRLDALKQTVDGTQSSLIAVHLRRGDRHPFEYAYQHGYLPIHYYKDAAESLASETKHSNIILSTDDPDMYSHRELSSYHRVQDRINLANGRLMEGAFGWEGGFFKDLFWGLALPLHAEERKRLGSPMPTRKQQQLDQSQRDTRDYRTHPTEEARQLREYIGRAYLLELEIMGNSDKVVCAVSSYACRILAVMMGWDKAIEQGAWMNVDGKFSWFGMNV